MAGEEFITYLLQGKFWTYFIQVFNFYFPYGLFFWMLGFTFLIITHLKTKNLGYSVGVSSFYFIVITSIPNLVLNAYSVFAMRYTGIIAGLVAGYYLYKGVRE